MNFQFETNMDAILNREDKIRNHKKIKIKILNPLYEYETLQKIDMDLMRPRKHEIFHKEKLYSQFKSTIITSVSCLGSGKLLTITSELLFINLTNKKIQISLIEDKKICDIDIAMGEKFVIPFDKIHKVNKKFINLISYYIYLKNIRFRYLSDENSLIMENEKESNLQNRAKWSDIYSLDKLMKNINSCYQTSHDKYFTLIKIVKEKEIGRIIIYFEPPYTIKNCLPMEVNFRIISENKQKSPPLVLPIQQEFQEHNISLDSQVFLKLKLPVQ